MAGFRLDNYSGIRPRASDVRLEAHEAINAVDVDLRRGFLRPRAKQLIWVDGVDPSITLGVAATPQTLYRFHRRNDDTDFWLYFLQDVDIVPGPAESAQQRTYYTGDEYPKLFTADSIDDTTPPYPEAADTKYPFTWFKLGVPAPDAAPVLDVEALPPPSEGSVGLITAVVTDTIIVNINNNLQTNSGLQQAACGEDGRFAGLNAPNMEPQGGSQILTCLKVGTRVRVTEIVDADNVRVVAAGRTGPIEDMGMIPDHGNWLWDNVLSDTHKHKALTRLNSTAKRKSFLLLPDEVVLTIDNHILRVDDIIRITGSAAPMSVTVTQDLVTTPVPSDQWINTGFRTATLDTANDFEFAGSTSFMIEREGSSIDPVVAATADFDVETRSYVYTYVSFLGEESAPSLPSDPVTIRVGTDVEILTFAAPPTERRFIDRIWIYRTNTGTDDTAFQFVGEVNVSLISARTITAATSANPVAFTTSVAHELTTGARLRLAALPGDFGTNLNGNTYEITVTSPTTFTIAVDGTAYAAYTSGGTATHVFVDNVPNDELGEVLETEGWDVPDENMLGLVALPNGFLAGFFDNVLCFSEPGFPHAWPPDYRQALDFDIVGLEVHGNALVVTTKGKPYIVVGVHPAQMSARHVDVIQSCADKRSIVKTDDSVLYCSFEGLISAGAGFVNVTEKYYTKEQWREIVGPDDVTSRSLRAWHFDSQYILLASYTMDAVTTTTRLIFDFRDSKKPRVDLRESKEPRVASFTEQVVAAFADPETAELYYVVAVANQPSGTPDAGERMLLRWDYEHPDADPGTQFSEGDYTTGEFRLPRPMAFSIARVQCRRRATAGGSMSAHGQVQLTVRGRRYDNWNAATTPAEDDVALISAQAVINGQPGVGGWAGEQRSAPFRIPTNVLVDAVRFEIHVEGPIEIESIQLGESMEDVQDS